MSRSGYSDDYEYGHLYGANVDRTIASKRGQLFLQELAKAMDEMPEKKLIVNELVNEQGQCCTIGVICKSRKLDVSEIDPEDRDAVGKIVGISPMMAADIAFMNDEYTHYEKPEDRWIRMRKWVSDKSGG